MSHILIADDSPVVRELLKCRIEKMGHQAFLAGDGEEAWRLIQDKPFDLIVLDQHMPNLEGMGVLRKIRNEPGLSRLPVVFFTSEQKMAQQEAIFALGVHDYIVKSVSGAEFEMRIRAILEREKNLSVEIDANLREIFRRSFRNYQSLPEMFAAILPAIANLMRMDFVIEERIQNGTSTIEYCFDIDEALQPGQTFHLQEGYYSRIAKTNAPVFISDAAKLREWKGHPLYSRMGIRSSVGIPLFVKGDFYGMLNASSRHPRRLDDFQIELMQLFARRISHEIEREVMQAEIVAAQDALIDARSLSSMSLMTASIAHEMRQPLTAADMDMADLVEYLTEGDGKELASAARSRLKEALLIIRAMMKVYRSGDKNIQNEVDVNDELRDIVPLFGRKTKGIEIVFDLSEGAQIVTSGNLSRIFMNLIGNAIDAMKNKGRLKIATRLSDENLLVIIEDNGCGIPLEIIGRIFEPEFTTRKTGEGTGLGLWIAKREVERMDGTISVESEVGKFTRFTVSFPYIRRNSKRSFPNNIMNIGYL
ncbi:MAG: ATP-binding protein [Thermodesulfobacteriota bacterium]